jgi:very-short-patch-repair endonuclease
MPTDPTLDAVAGHRAARQLGLITGRQATDLGFTATQVKGRVAAGRWRRIARDVFVITGAPPTWQQQVLAACLAGPQGAVASHLSAAALWHLSDPSPLPHITVPRTASIRLRIARVHRSELDAVEITRMGTIPLTRVPRTLVDLASGLSPRALERAVDTALYRRLTSPAEIEAAIGRAQRRPGRAGAPALRAVLAAWADRIRPESPAEARLLRRIDEWGLPKPVRQHVVRDAAGTAIARLDVAWPDRRVGLEYDGVAYHGPRRIEPDEDRHAAVEAAGWTLLHADRLDLRPGERRLRDQLRPLLGRRPAA